MVSAATSVPIVSRGLANLSDVLQKSNGELTTIGATIGRIGARYSALGGRG